MHLSRRLGPEEVRETRGPLAQVEDQVASQELGLVNRRDGESNGIRERVGEIVGGDHQGIGVVAELGEVGEVSGHGDRNRVLVAEAGRGVSTVGNGQIHVRPVGIDANNVPAIGNVIVFHVRIGDEAANRGEEVIEGLVHQDRAGRLVVHADLAVDRLDDVVAADRGVGVRRQAAAVRAVEVDALVDVPRSRPGVLKTRRPRPAGNRPTAGSR